MYRRFALGRLIAKIWTGEHRQAHTLITSGVVVDERTAELARRITAELPARIMMRNHPSGTALYLLDASGRPLLNHGFGLKFDKSGRPADPIWPVMVAVVTGGESQPPVSVFLEPVPGSSVGYAGNRGETVEEAATHIVRHYRPALDPTAEPWQWDTPWGGIRA